MLVIIINYRIRKKHETRIHKVSEYMYYILTQYGYISVIRVSMQHSWT